MIEVRNLSGGYERGFHLFDLNFRIEEKEFVGIIGPNGSGKTTLFRTITKILKPDTGEIIIDGKNILSMTYRELAKKIAVVSQDVGIDFMTVEEFVLLGRIPHYRRFQFLETKKDIYIAEKCMELTDTFRLRHQIVGRISSGERQLVNIARALTQQPKILLLDEPTTYLDIAHQVKILNLLRKLNRENNLTIIAILHDLNLASEYCNKLILLRDGRIHKIGTPAEVLTYQNIEEVYKTVVLVKENPLSKKPYVFVVPHQNS